LGCCCPMAGCCCCPMVDSSSPCIPARTPTGHKVMGQLQRQERKQRKQGITYARSKKNRSSESSSQRVIPLDGGGLRELERPLDGGVHLLVPRPEQRLHGEVEHLHPRARTNQSLNPANLFNWGGSRSHLGAETTAQVRSGQLSCHQHPESLMWAPEPASMAAMEEPPNRRARRRGSL
jgi:hypothetical protein